MAHYFHYLYIVSIEIFICIAAIYTWCNANNDNKYWKQLLFSGETVQQRIFSAFLLPIYIMANWLCIRFPYKLPLNLMIHNVSLLIQPINFFNRFIRPGC